MKPNPVFWTLAAAGAASALALALLAANAHGKRRARKAWLTEKGGAG